MTAAAFGEMPNDGGQPDAGSATTTHGANGSAQDYSVVDINDPRLTSESLDVNVTGDAYAAPPLLPAGFWRAKAKQVDIKDSKGTMQRFAAFSRPKMQNGRPFLATNVEWSVLTADPRFDGFKITDYWVKTLVEPRNQNTSQIVSLLSKGKQAVAPKGTDAQYMDQFQKWLASEPELVIEAEWEASCMSCQEKAEKAGERKPGAVLLGMHRFPQKTVKDENGKDIRVHDPVTQCPNCKAQLRAQVRLAGGKFWPVEHAHNK
jgi:hypothetical protein